MALYQLPENPEVNISYEKLEGVLPENTLFIHGNLASNRWWYPVEQEYRRKYKASQPKGTMIMAEFRGCGKSTAPKTVADSDMHVMANDYIQLVKGLNLAPINLVGHSTGGLIAALMMAKAPQLFKKAVLLDPVGARGVKFDDAMTGAFEAMKADKNLTATVMNSTIYQNDQESDFFKQVVVEDAFHAVKTVGAWVLKNLDGLDVRKEVSQIQNQVLVLHGEHDVLLSMKDSQELASLMTNARFETIAGQGHCTNAENPAKFAEISGNFLF